jgi:predicted acyltransferase
LGGERIVSLDQFRGYTVAAMFFVNFLGGFKVSAPSLFLHHHTYCSYADTIMPHFLFAVGFALRLVMLREVERHGRLAAIRRGFKRGCFLVLFGLVFYGLDGSYRTWTELRDLGIRGFFTDSFVRQPFQALTHIGVTTLWVLPVITLRLRWVVSFAVISGLLHLKLSHAFWYDCVFHNEHGLGGIDGGLLGFLTWTVCVAAGAAACDWRSRAMKGSLRPLVIWGLVLMAGGYAISCIGVGGPLAAPPFIPPSGEVDLWTMSQRAGSLSYLVFAAGFSLVVMALFVILCDLGSLRLTLFDDLGRNAFGAYVLHLIVLSTWEDFGPRDAPLWYALVFTFSGCLLSWLMTRWCNTRDLIFRL